MRSHTVNSTAAAVARYQARSKIIPASPGSHHTHTHSYIQMIKVNFYAQICSHTSAQTQVSAAALIFLQISAVIVEEGSYFHTEKSSGVVLIRCSSVLESEVGCLSGRRCLVKSCAALMPPQPSLSYFYLPNNVAAYTESSSASNNERLCLPDIWLSKHVHFSFIKTQTVDVGASHTVPGE